MRWKGGAALSYLEFIIKKAGFKPGTIRKFKEVNLCNKLGGKNWRQVQIRSMMMALQVFYKAFIDNKIHRWVLTIDDQ
jgi:hypothetical protein